MHLKYLILNKFHIASLQNWLFSHFIHAIFTLLGSSYEIYQNINIKNKNQGISNRFGIKITQPKGN